jgi:hypothetical protein
VTGPYVQVYRGHCGQNRVDGQSLNGVEINAALAGLSGLPHIYQHGIDEDEVEQVLRGPGDEFPLNAVLG